MNRAALLLALVFLISWGCHEDDEDSHDSGSWSVDGAGDTGIDAGDDTGVDAGDDADGNGDACFSPDDCDPDQFCILNSCQSECCWDGNCPTGEFCIDDECQPADPDDLECYDNSDCDRADTYCYRPDCAESGTCHPRPDRQPSECRLEDSDFDGDGEWACGDGESIYCDCEGQTQVWPQSCPHGPLAPTGPCADDDGDGDGDAG